MQKILSAPKPRIRPNLVVYFRSKDISHFQIISFVHKTLKATGSIKPAEIVLDWDKEKPRASLFCAVWTENLLDQNRRRLHIVFGNARLEKAKMPLTNNRGEIDVISVEF